MNEISIRQQQMPCIWLSVDKTTISIQFDANDNNDVSTFHAAWLWSNNPNFIHLNSKQRQVTPGSYRGSRIAHATICVASQIIDHHAVIPSPPPGIGCCHPIAAFNDDLMENNDKKQEEEEEAEQLLVCVFWEDSSLPSYYDFKWLLNWRYDIDSLRRRREKAQVAVSSICSISLSSEDFGGIQVFDYPTVINKDNNATQERGVYNVLHAIFTTGAAMISNAPRVSEGPNAVVALIGRALCGYNLSHGMLYGDTFHVKSLSASGTSTTNIAYTSLPLRPHQDLAYYESMPGLQLLHCVKFDDTVVGGESTLVDCMAAAHHLKQIAPDRYFKILTTIPATFVKQRHGANMIYQRPHIVCKSDDDDEIIAVNWSPPFEGPLRCSPQFVEAYYDAYHAFELMLDENAAQGDKGGDDELAIALSTYAKQYTWKYRLKPGEILIFNNRRMVHGRSGFSTASTCNATTSSNNDASSAAISNPSSKEHHHDQQEHEINRHLVGCYTNIDDTLNRYRTLQRYFGNADEDAVSSFHTVRNVGNGSSFIT